MTDLPPSWASVRLSDLGPWIGGGTPSKANPDYWNGPIPWVSPKDMKTKVIRNTIDGITTEAIERSSARRVPPKSVLIVTRSGILAHSLPVAVTAVESALNQDLKALNAPRGVFPDYIAWGLRACEQRILNTCRKGGTTVHSIEMPRLYAFELPIAPTNEQRRIVQRIEALFDEIDRGVESLRDARELIGLYRQSLLKSAFEGRLTADWRADNPDKLESPEVLVARIREERQECYNALLSKIGYEPLADGTRKAGRAGGPRSPSSRAPFLPSQSTMAIPGWTTVPLGLVVSFDRNLWHSKEVRLRDQRDRCAQDSEYRYQPVSDPTDLKSADYRQTRRSHARFYLQSRETSSSRSIRTEACLSSAKSSDGIDGDGTPCLPFRQAYRIRLIDSEMINRLPISKYLVYMLWGDRSHAQIEDSRTSRQGVNGSVAKEHKGPSTVTHLLPPPNKPKSSASSMPALRQPTPWKPRSTPTSPAPTRSASPS